MKKGLRKIFIMPIFFTALIFSACGEKEQVQTQPVLANGDETMDYSYVECSYGDVEEISRVRCEYKKHGEQGVYFPMSGKRIANVYVREGDEVKKGDVLVELDVDGIKTRIAALEYQIKRNEILLEHLNAGEELDAKEILYNFQYKTEQSEADKELYENSLSSLKENNGFTREDLEDSLEFDRLELKNLREELANSSVKAEFDGRVNSIESNLLGSTTNVEKCIMTIVDDAEGYFEADLGELTEYINSDDTIFLKVSGGSGRGEYKVVPLDEDEWTDKQFFSIKSGDNVMGLEAGTKGEMYIVTASRENVLVLPSRCIHPAGDEKYVYIINDEGRRDVVWVKTGVEGESMTEITEGLSEGDKVILR